MTPEREVGITEKTEILDTINNLQASVNALNFTYDFEDSFSEDIDLDRLKHLQAETIFTYLDKVIPFIGEISVNSDVFKRQDYSVREWNFQITLEEINIMIEQFGSFYGFTKKFGV